jgi:predicted alpha/beta-fold hydrolase
MPIKETSYSVPAFLRNGHVHTLYPFFLRKVKGVTYSRERLDLADGDFLDLDWSKVNGDASSRKLVILSHGLEGSTAQQYITGMVKLFNQNGFDCLAWNNRSCSGELNRLPSFYHSGLSQDLEAVIEHARKIGSYTQIALVGFSMGANQTLKYLGEKGENPPKEIVAAVTFSCPIDLSACSRKLARRENTLYMTNFLFTMKKKLMQKHLKVQYKNLNLKRALLATTFPIWDDLVTAPLSGFESGEDYYQKSSALGYLTTIAVPTLLVNAKDDPFLDKTAFPYELAREHENFHFESPQFGGHVGFLGDSRKGSTWSELRALAFLQQYFTA